jgi:hypothetical protein
MEIRPVGAELCRADGRTDMTKLIVAFRNFANAANKGRDLIWRTTSACVHYAANRQVAGSIPDGVIGIFKAT